MGKAYSSYSRGEQLGFNDVGHASIVQRFLNTRRMFGDWSGVSDAEVGERRFSWEAREVVRTTYAYLREAHIIEVPVGLWTHGYTALLEGLDTVREEVDATGVPPGAERELRLQEGMRRALDIFSFEPLPSVQPFEVVYLGYDAPSVGGYSCYDVNGVEVWPSNDPPGPTHFGSTTLGDGVVYAHLVTSRGDIIALVSYEDVDETRYLREQNKDHRALRCVPVVERIGGQAPAPSKHYPMTGANTLVPRIMEWVNDHKTVLETRHGKMAHRRAVQRYQKIHKIKGRVMPPPYYTVTMRDRVKEVAEFRNSVRRSVVHRVQQAYQYDVSAHDRIRVRRGPLPLEQKRRAWLEKPRSVSKKKYLIFEHTNPPEPLAAELWKRGVRRKRPDEWMAVLVTRVSDHRRNLGAPYVPSTRRSENHDKVAR